MPPGVLLKRTLVSLRVWSVAGQVGYPRRYIAGSLTPSNNLYRF